MNQVGEKYDVEVQEESQTGIFITQTIDNMNKNSTNEFIN